ncbi:DUF397 domain-containing protein [Streptomyces sp. NPDC051840]|uniref:DUF397 domain-containing protein n=1 Tax=Streptomyces sp. NPDC051840 TaxID=3154752 RepID=UPI003420D1EF
MRNDLYSQTIPANAWKKSSYSGGGSGSDCVQIAPLAGGRAIGDTKSAEAGELRVHERSMSAFLAGVTSGAFGG